MIDEEGICENKNALSDLFSHQHADLSVNDIASFLDVC
jgi:hypothetical protein